jgi:hypothetical protein
MYYLEVKLYKIIILLFALTNVISKKLFKLVFDGESLSFLGNLKDKNRSLSELNEIFFLEKFTEKMNLQPKLLT